MERGRYESQKLGEIVSNVQTRHGMPDRAGPGGERAVSWGWGEQLAQRKTFWSGELGN